MSDLRSDTVPFSALSACGHVFSNRALAQVCPAASLKLHSVARWGLIGCPFLEAVWVHTCLWLLMARWIDKSDALLCKVTLIICCGLLGTGAPHNLVHC